MLRRVFTHLTTTRRALRRAFPERVLAAIDSAIEASEAQHSAEIRFAVESSLELPDLLRGVTPRARAIETFSRLHVWDTEANNGVLVYLLLADHDIEIVADRGYNERISRAQWEAICREMEAAFASGDFQGGSLKGIELITELLRGHFPPQEGDRNELPNRPTLL